MIRDRGNKKWVSLMLPEHVKMLKDMSVDLKRLDKPLLDEYQIQEFEEKIKYAQKFKLPVEFSIFEHGFIRGIVGKIIKMDSLEKKIKIEAMNEDIEYIEFNQVTNVQIKD
ncbi:YolD-like family protein [Heyndrickxia vini]|uniref:YolD-like family protein n=1 Tax=Heyndrickxia vini TaxID=1476025 RepID=A0ABX7E6H3_9BACI|nr:YolD-like family protein [Heyndrickxia vini]QQZ10935.1 YolD-like family protein [Heyndrickxia vini]